MKNIIIIFLYLISSASFADSHRYQDNLYDLCFYMAEEDSGIKKELLRSIAQVESNQNHLAIGSNSPGKGFGIGLMQIDSQHLQYFKKRYFGIASLRQSTVRCACESGKSPKPGSITDRIIRAESPLRDLLFRAAI
ncbi:transglycosylase SLT domain-containing protein [Citrobacter braakii]|uniref:transglycosylase SLT domain-containing protein n=2 Tax=Citrobacter braakii TaxID=57706 RepID=UPI002B2F0ABF|nr:transglycosylase SLT domain-containing protein [Citrobacter braakii]WOR27360.1 transglycosylase SLT domain-containing protein [Citrobacter braakii]